MGPENQNPLDELQVLDQQIGQITELAGLKPIFFRLDELAKEHPGDFEVQLAVSEVKQRVVMRGTALKQLGQTMQGTAGTLISPSPPAPTPVEQLGTSTGHVATPTIPAAAVSSAFQTPPVSDVQTPPPPKLPPMPPPVGTGRPNANKTWKSALLLGVVAGAVVSIVVLALLVNQVRKRNLIATVEVQLATTPPGAAIRVNGEPKCNSNCAVSLSPGDYQVTAFLDGYEPAASTVKVTALQPASVNLKLEPQPQTVRILTDLAQGQVSMDDQPPADLQDGQFVINKVQPGTHKIKVMSKSGDASFAIQIAEAKQPEVTGPVSARNLIAVVVSSMGGKARVVTNIPAKLALNGQAQPDAKPAGVDANLAGVELAGFRPGVNEIAVGEGKDQRNLSESFGPAPMVTAFLKSDLNIGTLIISTAEDNVRVFLNGKEYPRKTQRGQETVLERGQHYRCPKQNPHAA